MRLAVVVDRDDAGMVQRRQRSSLPLEPARRHGIRARRQCHGLEGHVAAEQLVVGDVHDPHAAPSQLAAQPVAARVHLALLQLRLRTCSGLP